MQASPGGLDLLQHCKHLLQLPVRLCASGLAPPHQLVQLSRTAVGIRGAAQHETRVAVRHTEAGLMTVHDGRIPAQWDGRQRAGGRRSG